MREEMRKREREEQRDDAAEMEKNWLPYEMTMSTLHSPRGQNAGEPKPLQKREKP